MPYPLPRTVLGKRGLTESKEDPDQQRADKRAEREGSPVAALHLVKLLFLFATRCTPPGAARFLWVKLVAVDVCELCHTQGCMVNGR